MEEQKQCPVLWPQPYPNSIFTEEPSDKDFIEIIKNEDERRGVSYPRLQTGGQKDFQSPQHSCQMTIWTNYCNYPAYLHRTF